MAVFLHDPDLEPAAASMSLNTANLSSVDALSQAGYVLLAPPQLRSQLGDSAAGLEPLRDSWSRLPKDSYLRDGGSYRFRRHSCFVYDVATATLAMAPHRAHWQPLDYNALHGGMERWFEPIEPAVASSPAWTQLLKTLGALFAQLRPVPRWHVEAHQFRIDTAEGIGRPTPEGAHRDGVDYVAVILVNRSEVRGGETRVFEARGTAGVRFTMTEPWTTLLLDDARVIHETTPIQPLTQSLTMTAAGCGVRDTLVLTFRAEDFQAPPRT
jgi:hypothetical protein